MRKRIVEGERGKEGRIGGCEGRWVGGMGVGWIIPTLLSDSTIFWKTLEKSVYTRSGFLSPVTRCSICLWSKNSATGITCFLKLPSSTLAAASSTSPSWAPYSICLSSVLRCQLRRMTPSTRPTSSRYSEVSRMFRGYPGKIMQIVLHVWI